MKTRKRHYYVSYLAYGEDNVEIDSMYEALGVYKSKTEALSQYAEVPVLRLMIDGKAVKKLPTLVKCYEYFEPFESLWMETSEIIKTKREGGGAA